jgi:hypothetical protein
MHRKKPRSRVHEFLHRRITSTGLAVAAFIVIMSSTWTILSVITE